MKIQPLTQNDIPFVPDLLPKGWEGEVSTIESYIKSPFAFPVKASIDNKMVGIGTAIVYGETAWLAHIIVHPEYRNKGIGKRLTEALVETSFSKGSETIFLSATELGVPVYKNLGFEIETEYLIYKSEAKIEPFELSEKIIPNQSNFNNQIMDLDYKISGEDRQVLLEPNLSGAYIYLDDQKVSGFYLPDLGDGLIVASTVTAGIELMKLRLNTNDEASFPKDNLPATKFILQHPFREVRKEKRMRLGKPRPWQPEGIFNRIGGNLG